MEQLATRKSLYVINRILVITVVSSWFTHLVQRRSVFAAISVGWRGGQVTLKP